MKKISKHNRFKMIKLFMKLASSSQNCEQTLSRLIEIIEENGYDINIEDLVIKKQKTVDPIAGSPHSAYTLQNQLPTNGIPPTGDESYINDDNTRDISIGLANVGQII